MRGTPNLAGLDLAGLIDVLSAEACVTDAYLYGSSLRSDHVPGTSDVDLLVIVAVESTPLDFAVIASTAHRAVPRADVTLLTAHEVDLAIHPSGSRHFFVSVAETGVHLFGPDQLERVAARPLSFDETFRNTVQLCQRLRLVLLNPAKHHEREFWLTKSQHWIPCLLMELLHLHGAPDRRLRAAHGAFVNRFGVGWAAITYPYVDLEDVHLFLERLVRWLPANVEQFDAGLAAQLGRG